MTRYRVMRSQASTIDLYAIPTGCYCQMGMPIQSDNYDIFVCYSTALLNTGLTLERLDGEFHNYSI